MAINRIKYYLRYAITVAYLFIFSSVLLAQSGNNKKLTILFTSDCHSAAERKSDNYSLKHVSDNGDTISIAGGYSALATLIERQREIAKEQGSALVLLDAGDIAMGTAFHSIFTSEAFELRTLAKLKYDAFTFGNHDFDFGLDSLSKMFDVAKKKDPLLKYPFVLCANISPSVGDFNNHGLKDYVILNRNGVKIGLFGLMGPNSFSVVGEDADKLNYRDEYVVAKRIVESLRQQGVDYIIAISHGGTLCGENKHSKNRSGEKSDDGKLAVKVPGIDVIISGHDHQCLFAPLKINGTIIGACGAYNNFLGKMELEKAHSGKDTLLNYSLLPVLDTIAENAQIKYWVDSMRTIVDETFYRNSSVHLYDTIAFACREYTKDAGESENLGILIAKSYREAALKFVTDAKAENTIGLVPYGLIRDKLAKGAITYNNVFNILSLGSNENGSAGYNLVYAWLSGDELEDICELSVSVSEYMEDVKLFFDGLKYSFNKKKLPFTKVTKVLVNGKPLEKNKLYMLVTGEYTANLIGLLKSKSLGLLNAQPKDESGKKLENYNNNVVTKPNGQQLSEWMAFAGFLSENGLNTFSDEDINSNDVSSNIIYLGYFLVILMLIYLFYQIRRVVKKLRH